MKLSRITASAAILLGSIVMASAARAEEPKMTDSTDTKEFEQVTLGSGCFWCTEAVFEQLKGVKSAVSGYSGGRLREPDLRANLQRQHGPRRSRASHLRPGRRFPSPTSLRVFWRTHDPTTLNHQGHDVGTQYRSADLLSQRRAAQARRSNTKATRRVRRVRRADRHRDHQVRKILSGREVPPGILRAEPGPADTAST